MAVNIYDEIRLRENLSGVKNKLIVMSGKGGVGKSSVAANLALYLSAEDKKVGLIDIDFHGPNIPEILGVAEEKIKESSITKISPVKVSDNLKVVSIAFFLKKKDNPVLWSSAKKNEKIREFLTDVEWGALDYLIIDSPSGTGDELFTVAQITGKNTSAVVVATPQNIALSDVRKTLTFCNKLNVPVLGVVLNMSYFICSDCDKKHYIFNKGNLDGMLGDFNVNLLGEIPFDPEISKCSDSGEYFVQKYHDSNAASAFEQIGKKVIVDLS